jgi:hypothetical protein
LGFWAELARERSGLDEGRGGELGVAVDLFGGAVGGVGGAEVGAVAGEGVDPLLACLVEGACSPS